MKSVILQINDLIDQHEDYPSCEGCPLCDKIIKLRDTERAPEVKFKHILDKGQDMTRSDIEFLIDNEVNKKVIRKALNMYSKQFYVMLQNYGLGKKRDKKGVEKMPKATIDITPEEFIELHHVRGLSYDEISDEKEINKPALVNWKWRNKTIIEKLLKSNSPVEETPAVKTSNSSEQVNPYEKEIADLRAQIEKYAKRNSELVNRVQDLQAIHNACDDVESEIDSLQEEIKELQKENEAFRNLLKMVL